MNLVLMQGHLGEFTKSGKTKNDKTWASFSIGVKDDKKFTSWIKCMSFGAPAIAVLKSHPGDELFIQGKLETSSYEGKDGKRVYETKVVVSKLNSIFPQATTAIQPELKMDPSFQEDAIPF